MDIFLLLRLFCLSCYVGGVEYTMTIEDPLLNSLHQTTTTDEDESESHPICSELTWGSVLTDEDILDRIQTMLPEFEMKGLEPAIPVRQLSTYRSLPLTDCKVSPSGQLTFQVDVPVKAKNQDYQLFNFPRGSFSFEAEEGICVFEYPTRGIVETHGGSSIFPLSEDAWANCLQTNICQVPTADDVDPGDFVCLQALFGGKTGRELAPFCKFHCQPHPNQQERKRKEISDSFFFSWILK